MGHLDSPELWWRVETLSSFELDPSISSGTLSQTKNLMICLSIIFYDIKNTRSPATALCPFKRTKLSKKDNTSVKKRQSDTNYD